MINDNRVFRTTEDATVVDREVNLVLADASDNPIILIIPAPLGFGKYWLPVQNTGDSDEVTVTVAGGQTINGEASYVLPAGAGTIFIMDELGEMHTFVPIATDPLLGESESLVPSQAAVLAYVATAAPNAPASPATNTLLLAANVASTETVTIGADVYEVEIVNTDSTDNTAGGSFNNTTDPLVVAASVAYPGVFARGVGDLVRIQSEIMRITAKGATDLTFQRGVSGTTTAAHANALDIFIGNGIAGGSTVAVGLVTTLTPAAFSPALIDDINSEGTEAFTASAGASNAVVITADADGADATACSETLAGAGNVWVAAATYGGHDLGEFPLVYKALLSQTSTGAPIATVLANTLGSLVWTRGSGGTYAATLTGAFSGNVSLLHGDGIPSGAGHYSTVTLTVASDDALTLLSYDVTATTGAAALADALLDATYVEIQVWQ